MDDALHSFAFSIVDISIRPINFLHQLFNIDWFPTWYL